ncbi:MAG: hypothetical protein ACYDD1_15915 [Caulobacteraceae bacterium]
MKILALSTLIAAVALCTNPASALVMDATLGLGGYTADLGCYTGLRASSRFARITFNPATHERITYNVSRCSGGFINAWNEQNNKHWNVDINADGVAWGKDENGARWRYNPKVDKFTVLNSGKTCTKTDVRRVCE